MFALLALLAAILSANDHAIRFEEVSAAVGLADINAARVCVADLNGDDRPDVIVGRSIVYLNRKAETNPNGFTLEKIDSQLVGPVDDGVAIFVDFDNDGKVDAFVARYLDEKRLAERRPMGDKLRNAWWQRGRGDGTFDKVNNVEVPPKTACAIAAGDIDRDGRTDVFIGNWYPRYGESVEASTADLLYNRGGGGMRAFFVRALLPEDNETFDEDRDLAGRPVYGALIAEVLPRVRSRTPQLIELAYGRRWNRLYARDLSANSRWRDVAPLIGFDGDADRSGVYPKVEGATNNRTDEKPFRANGNTFDATIGDVNNDGRFDVFIAEITHSWAGSSSDRSRFLIAEPADNDVGVRFTSPDAYSVDRFSPTDGLLSREAGEMLSEAKPRGDTRWNQGDLFAQLVDVDHDGRLDLFLASGDYPDPPPFDERLRLLHQRATPGDDGRLFEDLTLAAGIDHVGCGQIATADFDCDGRMDIVAGESFNRFTPEMIEKAGGTPRVRLLLNRSDVVAPSIELRLRGPMSGVASQPFGAIVVVHDGSETRTLQLVGPGGHAGKQCEAIVHSAIKSAQATVDITWPCEPPRTTSHTLGPGRHVIDAPK